MGANSLDHFPHNLRQTPPSPPGLRCLARGHDRYLFGDITDTFCDLSFVIAGHSRTKDGVASLAYDPAIHDAIHQMQT